MALGPLLLLLFSQSTQPLRLPPIDLWRKLCLTSINVQLRDMNLVRVFFLLRFQVLERLCILLFFIFLLFFLDCISVFLLFGPMTCVFGLELTP